mmetsp:Transcript_53794/g.149281  ORF Transcript_53794/g.149281 Transcript_53794/m.149281 type:complete len:337 (+) Transcript_53794:255-1265(+)
MDQSSPLLLVHGSHVRIVRNEDGAEHWFVGTRAQDQRRAASVVRGLDVSLGLEGCCYATDCCGPVLRVLSQVHHQAHQHGPSLLVLSIDVSPATDEPERYLHVVQGQREEQRGAPMLVRFLSAGFGVNELVPDTGVPTTDGHNQRRVAIFVTAVNLRSADGPLQQPPHTLHLACSCSELQDRAPVSLLRTEVRLVTVELFSYGHAAMAERAHERCVAVFVGQVYRGLAVQDRAHQLNVTHGAGVEQRCLAEVILLVDRAGALPQQPRDLLVAAALQRLDERQLLVAPRGEAGALAPRVAALFLCEGRLVVEPLVLCLGPGLLLHAACLGTLLSGCF